MKFNYKKVEFSCVCEKNCDKTNAFLLKQNRDTFETVIYYKHHVEEEDAMWHKVMTLSDIADAALSVALQPEGWNKNLTKKDKEEFLNLK